MKMMYQRAGAISEHQNQEDLEAEFGEDAVVTRLGKINIVHTDNPSKELIRRRTLEVLTEEADGAHFEDDCPICKKTRDRPYNIIYYRSEEGEL